MLNRAGLFSCQGNRRHSAWAPRGQAREGTWSTELRSSHWGSGSARAPFCSTGDPGRFEGVEFNVPKAISDLGSDLKVIDEWRGVNPVSVREHLQIEMTVESLKEP